MRGSTALSAFLLLVATGAVAAETQLAQARGHAAASSGGTLLAAFLSGRLSGTFDRRDVTAAEQAYQQAATAPLDERFTWNNPETGNYGTVIPTGEGVDDGTRRACREYHVSVYANGSYAEQVAIGCRNPNGTWTVY